jgi:hypothetical protein
MAHKIPESGNEGAECGYPKSERYFRGLAGAGAISLGPNAAITEGA